MTPRVYLSPANQTGEQVELDAEQSLYLTQALRLKSGAALVVFDGRGGRREATFDKADKRRATIRLGPAVAGVSCGPLNLTLIQGVASGDRMDWVVEKAVELGVARIMPVICAQTSIKLTAERAAKRLAHWNRIAVAACRQSGRDDLPELTPVGSLTSALSTVTQSATPGFVLHPANSQPLTGLLGKFGNNLPARQLSLCVLVGPESGLTAAELQEAQGAGLATASLGPRVLRTETAGLVAAAIIQAALGDFANDC
ncbi:MAG: 16S rRNA (uracil(1498)-N(3))-methyltransferase [Burkholderiaceae bacterium]